MPTNWNMRREVLKRSLNLRAYLNHDMDREQAKEMIDIIAAAFASECDHRPGLKWSRRVRRSFFAWADNSIHTGPLTRRNNLERTIVHEMAHWLDRVRYDKDSARRALSRLRREQHHGFYFIKALKDVAAAWYGDAARYDWSHEYKSVQPYVPTAYLARQVELRQMGQALAAEFLKAAESDSEA